MFAEEHLVMAKVEVRERELQAAMLRREALQLQRDATRAVATAAAARMAPRRRAPEAVGVPPFALGAR
jgi:hypothetical protein